MSLKNYAASQAEPKWYAYWLKNKVFSSSPQANKPPYVVLMPPPNITGVLHMGHVLNSTVQDILVRRARMQGRETCWVPGLDHASIATEAKVVKELKKQGIEKGDLTRAQFLEYAWAWKEKYSTIILDQLKKLGVSCDWDRLAFTMDAPRSESVIQAFMHFYKEGYIYRGKRMINWDPAGKTALADDEVLYKEVKGHFYHISYPLVEDSESSVTVATTRPETLLGDTALCVHPEDPRYHHLIGKHAHVPLIGRKIPIIADPYVDQELGTGCLKITPAHDPNDYTLGLKHQLPIINIFTEEGRLNQAAQRYVGEDRFQARKKIVQELDTAGLLVKVIPHQHQVGFSERTDVPIEPRLSTQWFVKMKELVKPALKSVEEGKVRFFPDKFRNTYNVWLQNVRDWCISRQLWWGHRIPAYYLQDGSFVIAATAEEALKKAQKKTGNQQLTLKELTQDESVLDTWFSSALWPMSVFDGMRNPDNETFSYYYPTQDLVTGPDIIFFWVARMIIAGHEFTQKAPFRNVYFHGIVRDKKGRKMSKSLGNSPDPLDLIKKYGADGLRAGMLFCTPAGNDIIFDENLCKQGSKFVHKIWNARSLVAGWTPTQKEASRYEKVVIKWFGVRYQQLLCTIERSFSQYRLSEAFVTVYKLIWEEFCSHYLEMIKPAPAQQGSIAQTTYEQTIHFFEELMKLLHPFMPFITEEVWHELRPRTPKESISLASYPKVIDTIDEALLKEGSYMIELIRNIRHLRLQHQHSRQKKLSLIVKGTLPAWIERFAEYIQKECGIHTITAQQELPQRAVTFMVEKQECALPELTAAGDPNSREALKKKRAHYEQFLATIEKKLSNQRFLENAPQEVVALERKKYQDIQDKIATLTQWLDPKKTDI